MPFHSCAIVHDLPSKHHGALNLYKNAARPEWFLAVFGGIHQPAS